MTAWTSQRYFEGQRISILTICLMPSHSNMETSKALIKAWFDKRRDVKKIIDKIGECNFATLIDPSVELSDFVKIGAGSIICANTIAIDKDKKRHTII